MIKHLEHFEVYATVDNNYGGKDEIGPFIQEDDEIHYEQGFIRFTSESSVLFVKSENVHAIRILPIYAESA